MIRAAVTGRSLSVRQWGDGISDVLTNVYGSNVPHICTCAIGSASGAPNYCSGDGRNVAISGCRGKLWPLSTTSGYGVSSWIALNSGHKAFYSFTSESWASMEESTCPAVRTASQDSRREGTKGNHIGVLSFYNFMTSMNRLALHEHQHLSRRRDENNGKKYSPCLQIS